VGFKWKDSYQIGNALIDSQHEELFAKGQAFFDALDDTTRVACAMGLYQYTREHFAEEEVLMRSVNYPAMAGHIQQHDVLIDRLNAISESIAKGNLSSTDLESFLADWLLGHIRMYDTKLASYVSRLAPIGDAVSQ
jgi:hemerythrin